MCKEYFAVEAGNPQRVWTLLQGNKDMVIGQYSGLVEVPMLRIQHVSMPVVADDKRGCEARSTR